MSVEPELLGFPEGISFALDETIALSMTDSTGKFVYVNDAFCILSKYSRDELLGKRHDMLNSDYHSEHFFQEVLQTIQSGAKWKGVIRNKAKDGSIYWVQDKIIPQIGKDGIPESYICISRDITELMFKEENLKISLNSLCSIATALNESSIIVILDPDGKITYANDHYCDISKYSKEELVGEKQSILNSGLHPESFFKNIWKVINQGKVWKGEIFKKAKDGSFYWIYSTIVPVQSSDGKIKNFVEISHDITSRKKSEEMLMRTEKLSVIGELAAGVAHEIRNPLTSLRGFARLLKENNTINRDMYLDIIIDEIERINHIVNDFMVLAKPYVAEFKEKKILPIVMQVISLLESECHLNNIQIHLIYQESFDEVTVLCDQHQLKQVFLNLIKNGIEAMPKGGDIHVSLTIDEENVCIDIKDNGLGMSEQMIKRIGEPFYSTKEQGTGLGLMVSFNIIQNHKGTINVTSQPDQGTNFRIQLPKS
jgi:PAS domain S-box-containing protein